MVNYPLSIKLLDDHAGIILDMGSANERRRLSLAKPITRMILAMNPW